MKAIKLFSIIFLASLVLVGCLKDEVFPGPPVISGLILNPQAPSENEVVTISISVDDLNGIQSVKLYYKAGTAGFTAVEMAKGSSEKLYNAQIPGQASDVTVYFYIMAENVVGKKAYYPAGAPVTTSVYTVGAPLIVMNEIYSRGVPDDPDWIEIYNASDVTVDIGGYKIYDNGGQSGAKPKLLVPAGTTIPAKGFYVIVTDVGGEAGFGLSSGGEEVWFENAAGNIIDNVVFPSMDVSQSYGRNPDGNTNWELLNTITKGSPNSTAPPVAIIKINEVFSRGTVTNPDWVELYNASDFPGNIGGFKIFDDGGQSGTKPKKEIPVGTTIPSKGFFVIVVDDGSASGFGLGSSGEQIWLENAAAAVIDDVTFPALQETESYGRYPDGSANWQVLFVPTPGAPNDNTQSPPSIQVVMNEIYSRGTAADPDWIEIYNGATTAMDISGFKIYDNGGNAGTKPKKAFPAGTIIPANGFLVIQTEGSGDPNDFGLSSNGEEVWLEDATGNVIDNIVFPALSETQSFGRKPDGSANLVTFTEITKGSSNNNAATLPKK